MKNKHAEKLISPPDIAKKSINAQISSVSVLEPRQQLQERTDSKEQRVFWVFFKINKMRERAAHPAPHIQFHYDTILQQNISISPCC